MIPRDLAQFRTDGGRDSSGYPFDRIENEHYEYLVKNGRPHLCAVPIAKRQVRNETTAEPSPEEQEKELVRATNKGWELLQDMQGKPCLFYTTGWWSYSFCYNAEVKQFHSLPPGVNGVPIWPPTEDPTTPAYVLGKFEKRETAQVPPGDGTKTHEVVELQRKAETSYLVQRLGGGTPCDLTGQDRKIEIQFHCNSQTTDRIGWIKETATCSYLMIIYTPRLCNDVAFLPPKGSNTHHLTCYEVLNPDEVPEWENRQSQKAQRKLIDQPLNQGVVVGGVEVGARKQVGRDGKRIERGRVVMTAEEKAEIVAIQKDGRIEGLSKADLRKMDLNPEEVEAFRKEMQRLAGNKDWKIERLDDVNGNVQLRGVVSSDNDEKEDEQRENSSETTDERSEETYHEDI